MRWFDPITERWQDPPKASAPALTYDEQQKVIRRICEDETRRNAAPHIWNALVASATSSQMSAPPAREIEVVEDAALDPQVLYGEWSQVYASETGG